MATPHSAREGRDLVTSFTAVCYAVLHRAEPITAQYSVVGYNMCETTVKPRAAACWSSAVLRSASKLQQAEVTRPLLSLAKQGVVTRDYLAVYEAVEASVEVDLLEL